MNIINNEYCSIKLGPEIPIERVYIPKVIARITICGVLTMEVRENMNWNAPTPEQIKNLKEILNIDVELIGEDNGKKE